MGTKSPTGSVHKFSTSNLPIGPLNCWGPDGTHNLSQFIFYILLIVRQRREIKKISEAFHKHEICNFLLPPWKSQAHLHRAGFAMKLRIFNPRSVQCDMEFGSAEPSIVLASIEMATAINFIVLFETARKFFGSTILLSLFLLKTPNFSQLSAAKFWSFMSQKPRFFWSLGPLPSG